MIHPVRPLTIRNAAVFGYDSPPIGRTEQRDLYVGERVLDRPAPNAISVDLSGYTIYPGLINAHDHLELNHYPRTKFRERYDNAHQWGEDVSRHLDQSPYRELRAYPLWDRLFIGGLKNLLCGATTVAHHNTLYRALRSPEFPVRVLQRYGWSHSLHFSREADIVHSYKLTPKDASWFIHLAEGTDDIAAGEYRRLKKLGCVGKNTVIVHGVGLTDDDIRDACAIPIRGQVICPTTNQYLLGKTPDQQVWTEELGFATFTYGANIAIGSDSRLTADGDLWDEIRAATGIIIAAVNLSSAHLLRIEQYAGHLKIGAWADWIAIPQRDHYLADYVRTRRADLGLVVLGGVPRIGDPDLMAQFPHIASVPCTLDGKPKRIHAGLAAQIRRCTLREPGLILEP